MEEQQTIVNSTEMLLFSVGSGGSGLLLQKTLDDLSMFAECNTTEVFPSADGLLPEIYLGGTLGMCLTKDGRVFAFGEVSYDQSQKTHVQSIPFELKSIPLKISTISCGWSHAMMIDASHQIVFGFGCNKFGELGLGEGRIYVSPPSHIPLNNVREVQQIHCGFRQSFLIITRGGPDEKEHNEKQEMICTGSNRNAELTTPEPAIAFTFQRGSLSIDEILKTSKAVKVTSGNKFVCLLLDDGTLFGWGDNKYGQLASEAKKHIEPTIIAKDVLDVQTGWNHILLLSKSRDIFTLGRGDLGQLGNGSSNNHTTLQLVSLPEGVSAEQIACGAETCYIRVSETNSVYSWGWNEHGNLGINTKSNELSPIQVPISGDCKVISAQGAVAMIVGRSRKQ